MRAVAVLEVGMGEGGAHLPLPLNDSRMNPIAPGIGRTARGRPGRCNRIAGFPKSIPFTIFFSIYCSIYPGWWLGHPSEKYEFVNWDDNRNPILIWENKKWQPNHQPVSLNPLPPSIWFPTVFTCSTYPHLCLALL